MRETKEEIKRSVSLTQLISEYTPVIRNRTKCPFHPDRNPSLYISEKKGLWHCFGCDAGGDVFSFLMQADQINFPNALKILARRSGIPLYEDSPAFYQNLKSELNERRQRLRSLEDKRIQEINLLKKADEFLSGLWKRVNPSSWKSKETILDAIEECFSEIDDGYRVLERLFDQERKKIYGTKNV